MSYDFEQRAAAFPSLVICSEKLEPRGAFAEAQAAYLKPDRTSVAELERLLKQKQVGVVAHYYMDPQLQGVLSACDWPHIHISDSLEMASRAAEMVAAGVRVLVVLGVDFMSENARAMVDAAGYETVPVYRVRSVSIGCSLATAARSQAYTAYLNEAARTPRLLHVIYVNTDLEIKARAQLLVPTITCTSSNVVGLILQAAAQIPDLSVWFGPDTYMGGNLSRLFEVYSRMGANAVRELHPAHTPATLRELSSRFHYFREGVCIVHQMFGHEVARRVREEYADADLAAHLEVPGEMFSCALERRECGKGVVGSTANILQFISDKVREALKNAEKKSLKILLATEAGMITSIVRRVQAMLRESRKAGGPDLAVEIIFPVSDEAIAVADDPELQIVPGPAGGEGCSTEGGCAICPHMKMNSLEALLALLKRLGEMEPETLRRFEPAKYQALLAGRTIASLGSESIIYMRDYQRAKRLPDSLASRILRSGV